MTKFTITLLSLIHVSLHLFSQTTLDVVSFGGAIGNGITDDRNAIQNTIDAVHLAGGGTVTFPAGTFLVSKFVDIAYAGDHYQVICLQIYSNITLKGAGQNISTIKLMDNAGDFDAIISGKPSWILVDNFQLLDIKIDGNGSNNPVVPLPSSSDATSFMVTNGARSPLRLFTANNIKVENCYFTDTKSVWNIVFSLADSVIINNNIFDNIGDATQDWDHSTIYTSGDNYTLTNNQISSRNGAGTLGARTGIEIHGSNQYIANNIINGMTHGMNVTGFIPVAYESKNQTYFNNKITEALYGFTIWSGFEDDSNIVVGLEDVLFEKNEIELNPSAWINYQYYNNGAGFIFEQQESNRSYKNIFINNNEVSFIGSSIIPSSHRNSGFYLGTNNNEGVKVNGLYFLNNTVENSFGAGVYVDDELLQAVFSKNTLLNCGSDQSAFSAFRSGFFLSDTLQDVQISCNQIDDIQITPTLANVIINYAVNNGNCFAENNTTNILSAVPFNNASGYVGAWQISANKPYISFNLDSILGVEGSTLATLELNLSTPSSDTINVSIISKRVSADLNDISVSNLQYTFLPGETSKTINVNFVSDTIPEYEEFIELFILYTGDAFAGCNQSCKVLINDLTVGVNEHNEDLDFKIYPNPTNGIFTISQNNTNKTEIEIYNMLGILIYKTLTINKHTIIDLSNQPKGIYIVHAIDNNRIVTNKKVVIQ